MFREELEIHVIDEIHDLRVLKIVGYLVVGIILLKQIYKQDV
jgi:hypothetical protein